MSDDEFERAEMKRAALWFLAGILKARHPTMGMERRLHVAWRWLRIHARALLGEGKQRGGRKRVYALEPYFGLKRR